MGRAAAGREWIDLTEENERTVIDLTASDDMTDVDSDAK
jgi:hypothetical protein